MAPTTTAAASVRPITVDAGATRLSGLLAAPPRRPPRAALVALHGGGMRARYFHGEVEPGQSLLEHAAGHGYLAVALDRPGYGLSAGTLPEGTGLAEQVRLVRAALTCLAGRHATGAGFVLLGHSLGGKVALLVAAEDDRVRAVDVSGVGHRWAADPGRTRDAGGFGAHRLHWGPLGLYPPGTFQFARDLAGPLPPREAADVTSWPDRYDAVAGRIRVPVRLTFAEHERWWRHDEDTLRDMTARLSSPVVRVERLAGTGHNISLSRVARTYHARALAFFDSCLGASRDTQDADQTDGTGF